MAMYDDPRILRAIAHPTRDRILSELSAAGSLRAADIARLLDIPANQASFHLRQLAKYGLVAESPEEARDRRDRVWRLADADAISFRTRDMLERPGGKAAYAVFRRSALARGHHLVDRALAIEPDSERSKSVSESALRLTAAESEELMRELNGLVEQWRRRTQGGEGDRLTYSVYQLIQPYPGDGPGDEDAS